MTNMQITTDNKLKEEGESEISRSIKKISVQSSVYHQIELSYVAAKAILCSYEKQMKDCIQSFQSQLWIECENIYYIPKYELLVQKEVTYPNEGYTGKLHGITTTCFTSQQAKDLFYDNKGEIPLSMQEAFAMSFKYGRYISCECNQQCLDTKDGVFYNWRNEGTKIKISSAKMILDDFVRELLISGFKLIDEDNRLSILKAVFNLLLKYYGTNEFPPFSTAQYNEIFIRLCHDSGLMNQLSMLLPVKTERSKISLSGNMMENLISEVLGADNARADLEPDDRRCVEDINLGHWELWNADKSEGETVNLERDLVARNPAADIHRNGIVGIDFGTKSTIVSCQDGSDNTSLLRVGLGQLNKTSERSHYENPTILEFVNLEAFLNDYKSEGGRPHTHFKHLYVSHRAVNNLKDSNDSGKFYSYFYNIKQWCGSSEQYQHIKIIDQEGTVRLLPRYLECNSDFDPVEIYAYYLGLFINNMRNGIYLNYLLSFPAMYSKAVRNKMLASFKRGLMKSLPETIIGDEDIMKDFSVTSGISEPEAYAITALQQYGFAPEGDEKVYYGIFDFGGGTTDYDFGIWREADWNKREEESYDYVITHLENGGDKYLGGENLLEKMAFEVFKANADKLRASDNSAGYSFCMPVGALKPAGMETLISESQEARRNTKTLMEALRPFWEGLTVFKSENVQAVDSNTKNPNVLKSKLTSDSYQLASDCKIMEKGFVTVTLFDKAGKATANFQLDIINKNQSIHVDMLGILETEIDKGVRNFFEALRPLFDSKTTGMNQINQVQIFIAGNSGKSPILANCFKKHIAEYTKKAREQQKGTARNKEYFVIFPSLGTPEAIAIQRERGITVNPNDILSPTGKTGVAYGLIEGRSGGRIKVITDQTPDKEAKFKLYLGIARKGRFICKTDRNIAYNEWQRFGNAGSEIFELYYSTLPESTSNMVETSLISKVRLPIETVDIEADVFIRAVSPTEIEYVVANESGVKNGTYLCGPKRVELT